MPKLICNGQPIETAEGVSVAAALLNAELPCPVLCAMGVCMQCRVTIDGQAHRLACQTLCRDGMEVRTP